MSRFEGYRCRWLATLLLVWAGVALAEPPYESLPAAKALAISPAQPGVVRGIAHSQPNDLQASIRAREQCQARAPRGETCELLWLNDTRITTGAEILERVPDEAHPLFLWRFQRDSTVVYLAGSIHILKPSLYPLPAQLEGAFEAADYLVVEVDMASLDPGDLRRHTLKYALLPQGQTLIDVLPAALHQRLDEHLADFGLNAGMVSALKPAMVMNQLVISRLLTLGYLPDSGLENYFLSKRSSQQILELESLDEQLALLFDQPLSMQIELLAEALDTGDHIEPLLAEMLSAWLSGDDETFLELFRAQSGDSEASRAFLHQLLDERNQAMAERIRAYLQGLEREGPATYFVLVGAAHLVGENGIVTILSRAGLEGERLSSDDRIIRRKSS